MRLTCAPLVKPRLLIVGCGDIGLRLANVLGARWRVYGVTSQREHCARLRQAGVVPIVANLDQPASLARLRALAPWVVHLAPPEAQGEQDRRTRHLVAALGPVARMVYVSTTGVYGDCDGALVGESRPVAPASARARRRVDAETVLRGYARATGCRLSILRVPGIYDGAARLPRRRLELGTPALEAVDDVYTNHIHADDLARIILLALGRGRSCRVYHAADDTRMKMGDYFDCVADAVGLARAPRLSRSALAEVVSPLQMSFMSESRQIDNSRLKAELRVRLHYPEVGVTLAALAKNIPTGAPAEREKT